MIELPSASSADVAYVEGIRKARDKRAVLKMRFVDVRGRCPNVPILAFEGDDDKIVYGRWISRLRPHLAYEAFVCRGKNGIRALQAMLISDLGTLSKQVFLFADRDFDDHAYLVPNLSLFLTDRYSVENYLVTSAVLDSTLRDELPCNEHPDIRDTIVGLFERQYGNFLKRTKEFNWLLFKARRSEFSMKNSLPDKLGGFAKLTLNDVEDPDQPASESVQFDGELDADVEAALREEFEEFDPRHRYRGKNAWLFFDAWIGLLCFELAKKDQSIFGGPPHNSRIRREELGIGTFASKSAMPLALPDFLDRIAA